MAEVGRWMLILGLLLALGSQVVLARAAFLDSVGQGMLCIAFPGYVVLWARRNDSKLIWCWLAGIVLFVLGLALHD